MDELTVPDDPLLVEFRNRWYVALEKALPDGWGKPESHVGQNYTFRIRNPSGIFVYVFLDRRRPWPPAQEIAKAIQMEGALCQST